MSKISCPICRSEPPHHKMDCENGPYTSAILHGTVTTEYHDKIVQEAMDRVATLDKIIARTIPKLQENFTDEYIQWELLTPSDK